MITKNLDSWGYKWHILSIALEMHIETRAMSETCLTTLKQREEMEKRISEANGTEILIIIKSG